MLCLLLMEVSNPFLHLRFMLKVRYIAPLRSYMHAWAAKGHLD